MLLLLLLVAPLAVTLAACFADFKFPPAVCGDGILAVDESCDDGNAADGDGCSSSCSVEPGWACLGTPSDCTTHCGDGIRAGQEQCDATDLDGVSCSSLEHPGGELLCTDECELDLAGCLACGDGICASEESETIDNCAVDCGFVQLSVGYHHNCATRADGTVWCWGDNGHGQLGSATAEPFSEYPVQVVGITGALQVDTGGPQACALALKEGVPTGDATAVWCWGSNEDGQVGAADFVDHPVPVEITDLGSDVVWVDVGYSLVCALRSDGSVMCWGVNHPVLPAQDFSLGSCSYTDASSIAPISVEIAGVEVLSVDSHTGGALLSSGEVWCWGTNDFGQRGDGTVGTSSCSPNQVALPTLVDTFAMGDLYAMAIESDGTAWAWGRNEWGQLGDATLYDRSTPVRVRNVPPLKELGLGWRHTCAITEDDGAMCWGRNNLGQLGAARTDSTYQGPVEVVGLQEGVRQAVAGGVHSCALLDSGRILCWGGNNLGQLGDGMLMDASTPQEIVVP